MKEAIGLANVLMAEILHDILVQQILQSCRMMKEATGLANVHREEILHDILVHQILQSCRMMKEALLDS